MITVQKRSAKWQKKSRMSDVSPSGMFIILRGAKSALEYYLVVGLVGRLSLTPAKLARARTYLLI
jgi:hypothetical protein